MVDLSGGQDGPLEHAFSNSVFILPAIIVISLSALPALATYFEYKSGSRTSKMAEMDAENLQKLEEMLKGDGDQLPSTKEILDMLETTEMDEELRENLRSMLSGGVPKLFGGAGTYMAVLFVLLIFSIILFFGYKLYKSIKEKEKKREEKKKLKQMKKKK